MTDVLLPITLIANELVNGDRQNVYGHPFDDFSKTAALWSVIFGIPVSAEQVALAMIMVKISRLLNTPDHRDSIVDIAGYAETLDKVNQERKIRESDTSIF